LVNRLADCQFQVALIIPPVGGSAVLHICGHSAERPDREWPIRTREEEPVPSARDTGSSSLFATLVATEGHAKLNHNDMKMLGTLVIVV
jgi:hypothetical protein